MQQAIVLVLLVIPLVIQLLPPLVEILQQLLVRVVQQLPLYNWQMQIILGQVSLHY